MRLARFAPFAVLLGVAACDRTKSAAKPAAVHTTAASIEVEADAGARGMSASSELVAPVADAGSARSLVGPATSGQRLEIAAGTFASGSTPGDEGREPAVEPALVDVTLDAYAIDALPHPNDPAVVPSMVGSQAEAERLCAERGARLCTELEWERACKGPDGDPFATGVSWNEACDTAPSRCASGFGARAMGFLPEWTASTFAGAEDVPVVRGGPRGGHRCAARTRATDKSLPAAMAFRCCHGPVNDAAIERIASRPAFRKTTLEAADLARIFGEIPELSRIRDNVRLHSDADVKNILARSSSSGDGIVFATTPILWSPEPGVELLVATGHAKRTGFVVALHVLPGDKYRFASSFLLLDDPSPVALAYEPSRRRELRWTTCWSCAGEQGEVSVRDDGRIVIVQY